MEAPRTRVAERQPSPDDRRDPAGGGTAAATPTAEQRDAELAASAIELQVGLQVTDVSDTLSNDLIDLLFRPLPRSR